MTRVSREQRQGRGASNACTPGWSGPRTGSGFTLIELLVVVAIIALLIAILVPSLGRAKAESQRVACASNLRQMGVAIALYTNEFDQMMTPGIYFANPKYDGSHLADNGWGNNVSPVPYPQLWLHVLVPYSAGGTVNFAPGVAGVLKNQGYHEAWGYDGVARAKRTVFWCPTDTRDVVVGVTKAMPNDPVDTGLGISYAPLMNADPKTPGGNGTVIGHKFPTIVTPGDTVLFMEEWNNNGSYYLPYWGITATGSPYGDATKFPTRTLAAMRFRHNNQCNVAYVDGHGESLTAGKIPPQGTPTAIQNFWGFGTAWGY